VDILKHAHVSFFLKCCPPGKTELIPRVGIELGEYRALIEIKRLSVNGCLARAGMRTVEQVVECVGHDRIRGR
jgi:hypothetical protein